MSSAPGTAEVDITASGERIVEKIPGSKIGQPKDRSPVQDGGQNPAAEAIPSLLVSRPFSKTQLARARRSHTSSRPEVRSLSRARPIRKFYNVHCGEDTESDSDLSYRHQRPRATGSIQQGKSLPHRHTEVPKNDLYSFDAKQDREIVKQRKEIKQLEKELHRQRHKREEKERHPSEEDRGYEKDISERLKRLDEIERGEALMKRAERRAEEQFKIRKLEEAELQAKRKENIEAALREKDWMEMKKKIEKKEMRGRIRKELRDEEMRRKLKELERINHEDKIRRAAVEDYKLAEEQRLLEEERQKRQLNKEYRAAIEAELGYSLEQVKDILTKATGKNVQKQSRERKQAFSATVHDVSSGDEADVEAI